MLGGLMRLSATKEFTRFEKQLSPQLQTIGKRAVVIVTDRYPPDSHGGAELSLHAVLRETEFSRRVVVVVGRDVQEISTYSHEGVDVLVLPAQGDWPLQHWSVGRAGKSRLFGFEKTVEERLPQPDREYVRKLRASPPPRGGYQFEDLVSDGVFVRLLRAVIDRTEAQLVHADNYRSIVNTWRATADTPVKTVGLIRDNRFHCVRHSQSVSVGGHTCKTCDFACVNEDKKDDGILLLENLRRTADHRRRALTSLDSVVVTSRYLERSIRDIAPKMPTWRVPNSADPLSRVGCALRGVPEMTGLNLLVVGMLNENKGQVPFVRELPDLIKRIPSVHLHLAGRGVRIEERIREITREQGTSRHITIHGYLDRDALYRLYRRIQIVVLPTLWPEPFGRVPLEAGTARKPCVAFSVGGITESIVDGKTGVLVEPGDYGALVKAITVLAEKPELRDKMGDAAFSWINQQYALSEHGPKLLDVWKSVLGDKHRE